MIFAKYTNTKSKKYETTLYMFKAEHQVIILSSLPRVIVDDDSPPTMDVGRLLRDPDVEPWRSDAILSKLNRCPASGIKCFSLYFQFPEIERKSTFILPSKLLFFLLISVSMLCISIIHCYITLKK